MKKHFQTLKKRISAIKKITEIILNPVKSLRKQKSVEVEKELILEDKWHRTTSEILQCQNRANEI